MQTANKFNIGPVIESLINGQFTQAKEQTIRGCKTKPQTMAYRVGQVVVALCDPDGYRQDTDTAVRFLSLFEE